MSPRPSPEQQARNERVDRIVELFASGYSQDYVCEQGVLWGWTRDDVLTVVKQRGWPLDKSGRLPLRMRPRTPSLATRTARGARGPKTPTEGTPPETVRAGGAGTAPDSPETGHGNAGPAAQPQVSPSRSHLPEDGGVLGASGAPAEDPTPVAVEMLTAEEIRARVDALADRTLAGGSINPQHVAIEQDLRDNYGHPSFIAALDGPGKFRAPTDQPVDDSAADDGGVVHPAAAASDPVENPDTPSSDLGVATPGNFHRRTHTGEVDLLAVGLEHAHPAVRAKAQIVVKAVDALVSAMARHRDA